MNKVKNGWIIDDVGSKRWYLNGKRHRADGPAIEHVNGNKYWYSNDQLHRTDGPAVEYSDGDNLWCLNGINYNFEDWLQKTSLSEKEKVKLRLQYAK